MADKLRPILDAYLAGGMPPNIALMRLCMEAGSSDEVRAAIQTEHVAPSALAAMTARRAALMRLLDEHPSAWATIREVISEAEHSRAFGPEADAVAHWASVFDRLAREQPEASVALYALGSPELLDAATGEVVDTLRALELLASHAHVLEIGCGIGRFVRALAPHVGRVTGLDVSREMIIAARRRCAGLPNVHLEVSLGRDLAGLPDTSIDLVLAADVFPYLVQAGSDLAARHVAEAHRVLRPGGTLALLNFSYRGDSELDRRELLTMAQSAGFMSVTKPTTAFRYWDGSVFLIAKGAA